jgi:hypothetical protein
MINDNLYASLKSIYDPTDTGSVVILEANQAVVYGDEANPINTSNTPLITYLEETKQPMQKGDKFIEGNDIDGYNYKYKTRYWIDTIINFYGIDAESNATRLLEVLNNNEDNFIDNDLGIISYGNIQNLTFLENGEYTDRFAISLKLDYNLIRESGSDAYLVKEANFTINQES